MLATFAGCNVPPAVTNFPAAKLTLFSLTAKPSPEIPANFRNPGAIPVQYCCIHPSPEAKLLIFGCAGMQPYFWQPTRISLPASTSKIRRIKCKRKGNVGKIEKKCLNLRGKADRKGKIQPLIEIMTRFSTYGYFYFFYCKKERIRRVAF